jgi:hypothetical protein
MKQEAMETEMADSPQKKSQKSSLVDDDVEEYEYKTVRYKDFITKPKYIRSSPSRPLAQPCTDGCSMVDSGGCGWGTDDIICGKPRQNCRGTYLFFI